MEILWEKLQIKLQICWAELWGQTAQMTQKYLQECLVLVSINK